MSRETPEGWVSCKIGEVTQIVSGGTPPSKDLTNFTTEGGIPWITPADLSGYKDIYISRGARNLFVYFYLKHTKPVAEAMATGTTFKELSGSVAAQLPLLIAPLTVWTEPKVAIANRNTEPRFHYANSSNS